MAEAKAEAKAEVDVMAIQEEAQTVGLEAMATTNPERSLKITCVMQDLSNKQVTLQQSLISCQTMLSRTSPWVKTCQRHQKNSKNVT